VLNWRFPLHYTRRQLNKRNYTKLKKKQLRGFSPKANYTDRAAVWRNCSLRRFLPLVPFETVQNVRLRIEIRKDWRTCVVRMWNVVYDVNMKIIAIHEICKVFIIVSSVILGPDHCHSLLQLVGYDWKKCIFVVSWRTRQLSLIYFIVTRRKTS
jgi:hypothetical protein